LGGAGLSVAPGSRLLPRSFFDRPVNEVAVELLGCLLSARTEAGVVALRPTEAEAYGGPDDPGSHAFRGRTRRNATMYGDPGHAYVYFTYGMHWCLNLVCHQAGDPAAVLLRAGEVVAGELLAAARRPRSSARDLARGPARMTRALGVDGDWDGLDVTSPASPLQVSAGIRVPAAAVSRGPRVGVSGAGAGAAWRYRLTAEPSVSAYRPAVARRRTSG